MEEQTLLLEEIQKLEDTIKVLQDKYNSLNAEIGNSPEMIKIQRRLDHIQTRQDTLRGKIEDIIRGVNKMFTEDGRPPYYSRSCQYRGYGQYTNIRPEVLSAIAQVSPLSYLKTSNIKELVQQLIDIHQERIESSHPEIMRYHAEIEKLRDEEYALLGRVQELEKDLNSIHSALVKTRMRLSQLYDMKDNPQKYKSRPKIEEYRQRIFDEKEKILQKIIELQHTTNSDDKEQEETKSIITSKDIVDLRGMTIPKGTTLFIIAEGPEHPSKGYKVLKVRVDNGTGDLSLMPETAIRNNQL